MEQNPKKSIGLIVFPFIVSGTYFAYSRYYKKHDLSATAGITAIIFLCCSLPLLSNQTVAQSLTVPKEVSGTNTSDSHLNKMDSIGRKEAIDYIISRLVKFDSIARYSPPGPPSIEKRTAAYNTLTNDELKVMYCIYKFTEDKDALVAKYGSTSSDELAKKAAKETYGIDLGNVTNVEKTASVALTKVTTALATK